MNLTNPTRGVIKFIAFVVYATVLAIAIYHHEMWGDELHSWNIAKASPTFFELLANIRYEGHPPLWYILLWVVSKCTHQLGAVQLLHYCLACATAVLLIYRSPYPFWAKLLIPFGYFFIFEYAVLSRNYAPAVLLIFCLCIFYPLKNEKKQNHWPYYLLLFMASNTHLLALVLAASLHGAYILQQFLNPSKQQRKTIFIHTLLGALVLLPAANFIFPPSDSEMNVSFWVKFLHIRQLSIIFQAPLKALLPLPAWWEYNFWNTHFLVALQSKFIWLKVTNGLLSVCIVVASFKALAKCKPAVAVFALNLLFTFLFALFFSLTSTRYVGFLYIGFLASLWVYCASTDKLPASTLQITAVWLFFQLIPSAFVLTKDIKLPFSNAFATQSLLKKLPTNAPIATDYWCLNNLAAFADRPFYCVEYEKELSFLLWDKSMATALARPARFASGLEHFMASHGTDSVYMVTIRPFNYIVETDSTAGKKFNFDLVDEAQGAIEAWGNMYVYKVSPVRNRIF